MSYVRLTILASCLLAPAVARAADGSLALYLQPLPADAAALTFKVGSLAARTVTGAEYPLTVALPEVSRRVAGRQRLLASGRVPPGSYAGFTIGVTAASAQDPGGAAALPVPDAPTRLDFPFTVGHQGSLFWFELKYDEATAGAGFSPAFAISVPPRPLAGHAGFVSNAGANTITVFDKRLGQAVAVIDTCAGPGGMALDQPGRRLYVPCARDNEVQVVDVVAAEVSERSRLSIGDRPREAALTPDGRTLVTVNTGSNSVTVFDARPLAPLERIGVGSGPGSVAIDPAGRRAFVFNTLSNAVSVVDLARRVVVGTVPTETGPLRGAFNARGDRLFVIHERSPYVTVIDPQQLAVVTRTRVRSGLGAIKADVRRNLLYLGGPRDPVVEFYDPGTLLPVSRLALRGGVAHLAVDAEENTLYVVSPGTRSVVVGSLADRAVVAEIDVGDAPAWVSAMGEK